MTPEQADILWEVRGIAGIEGVYSMPSEATSRRVPPTVVVLERSDAYVLAAVTCALIRAIPDRDRFHVGVSTASRFHSAFDLPPLRLETRDQDLARERATRRGPAIEAPLPKLPNEDELTLELIWMIGSDRIYPLEIVVDPFRELDPSRPVLITGALPPKDRRHAWQTDTVGAAIERLGWADPKWIACDEDLALGDNGLLEALAAKYPAMLERTMVVATEVSADWMRKLVARRYPQARVVVRSMFGVHD